MAGRLSWQRGERPHHQTVKVHPPVLLESPYHSRAELLKGPMKSKQTNQIDISAETRLSSFPSLLHFTGDGAGESVCESSYLNQTPRHSFRFSLPPQHSNPRWQLQREREWLHLSSKSTRAPTLPKLTHSLVRGPINDDCRVTPAGLFLASTYILPSSHQDMLLFCSKNFNVFRPLPPPSTPDRVLAIAPAVRRRPSGVVAASYTKQTSRCRPQPKQITHVPHP